jgi:hypothetical protein
MIYDRLLIQVRERPFLDLLDLTFQILRERPLALSISALIGVLPCFVLNYYIQSDPGSSPVFFAFLLFLETPFATAPLTVVLGDLMFNVRVTPRRVGWALLAGLPSLFLYQLIVRGVLLVTILGYILFPSRLAYLNEVILLERMRAFNVLRRAGALCRGLEVEYFFSWVAQVALGATFVLCFATGTRTIVSALFGDELTWSRPRYSGLSEFLIHAAIWIAIAYFATFRFLSYIDRRIRLEGWELELRLKAAGRALEESTP